jgi:PEP-CTERM motif
MRTHMQTLPKMVLALAGTVAAMGLGAAPAKGAAALWISAPTWSYSAAAAASPVGSVYFWGLSVGVNSYSWAGAFSNDGLGDAAYAYATARAGRGGLGLVLVTGFADPWAGGSIDIPLLDPSLSSDYPSTNSGTDPFASAPPYSANGTGITFTEHSSDLNGDFELEAFAYNGSSLDANLQSELHLTGDTGSTLSGDVTDFADLTTDLGLIPLDAPIDDQDGLSSLSFTENPGAAHANGDNVVLVGIAKAVPEPASVVLLSGGMAGLGLFWRKRRPTA